MKTFRLTWKQVNLGKVRLSKGKQGKIMQDYRRTNVHRKERGQKIGMRSVSLAAIAMMVPTILAPAMDAATAQTRPSSPPSAAPGDPATARQGEEGPSQAEIEAALRAQEAARQLLQPKEAPVIKGIAVRGNQRIEPETVASYLTLQPGMEAEEELLDLQIKTLYQTGLFASVSATMTQDGTLLVEVKENPIVNRILFEGNKRMKEDKFTEEIQLTARSVYTRAKVQADQQRMIELYRATGRFAATVTPKVVPLAQNRVDVIFEIDEGPKTGIAKVNFVGNDVFTSAELRKVILTSESRWWNLFGGSTSNYDPDRLEYERELLRQHYAKNGYADFKVNSLVAELTPDRKEFFVTFNLDEGPQYTVGDVKVRSALDKLDESVVERIVPIREGQTFNGERIENAVESLTFLTGASGYAFVDVNPRLTRYPESKTVDITFEINEGPKVYVERINIKGNTTTLDKVIRRELRIAEGDPFNKVSVNRSEAVIRALGFFSDVEITEKPGSAPDRTELDVAVTEQATGAFSIGVGVSSTDNFIADVSVEQRNFLGRGQALRFRVQASQRTRQVDLRFTQPRFLGRNLTAGGSLFYSRLDNTQRVFGEDRGLGGFVQEQFGFGLNAGFQISEYGQASINYLFSRSDVDFGLNGRITPTFQVPNPNFELIPNPVNTDDDPDNDDPDLPLIPNGPEFITEGATVIGNQLFDPEGNVIDPLDPASPFALPANITQFGLAPFGTTVFGQPLEEGQDPSAFLGDIGLPSFTFDDCSDELVIPQFRCESEGRFTTSLVGATLAFSTINDPFNPRSGWRWRGTLSLAGLGGNVQYVRGEFDAAYYKPLPLLKDFIGALKLRGGYIRGFAGDTVRIQDRFRLGAASFRGFEIAGVGPRIIIPRSINSLAPLEDPETGLPVAPTQTRFANVTNVIGAGGFQTGNNFFASQSIGGNAYLIGSAEVLLPLPLPESYGIRATLFTDFGTVGLVDEETKVLNDNLGFFVNVLGIDVDGDGLIDDTALDQNNPNNPNAGQDFFSGFVAPIQDDLSFRLTAGVTVSWNSPFGPIRFDIAEVFIREFYDEVESFRFSAGTAF